MAQRNKHAVTIHIDFEYLLIFLYILVTLILFFTGKYTLAWFYFLTGSLLFWLMVIKILSKLFYRVINFQSIILDTLQEVLLRILFKIGLGKYVAKVIVIVNEEKGKQDNDPSFKPYLQYFERKKLFSRLLIPRLRPAVLLDMGGDSLYVAKHYLHKKRNDIEQAENTNGTKHFNTLSNREFKDLITRLFQKMGYTVRVAGESPDHIMDIVLQLKNQTLFIRGIKHSQLVTVSEIKALINAQRDYDCNGSMLISIPYVAPEIQSFAYKNALGIITKERLQELLLQYLKEKWD